MSTIAACGGSDGTSPTASGVFPAEGFAGRKLRVEISGDATSWADGATVSFGAGVTVGTVTVASPTDLFAEITIDPAAALGPTDVTVTSGGTFTLKQAFEVVSPIELKIDGTVAQGSVGFFTINNRDFDNQFDDTHTGDGFLTPIVYTNISFTTPSGVTMQANSVTAYSITGTAFFDLDATSGPVSLQSGPSATAISSKVGTDMMVAPRTATALTSGTAVTGSVTNADDSTLYSFTTAAGPALTLITASSSAPGASPAVALLPSSGKWADMIAFGSPASVVSKVGGDMYYVVYLDTSGTTGTFSVKATGTTMAKANDTEPNNTGATAQGTPYTLPFFLDNATLSDANDQDWIKVTVPAGKKIHIVTLGDSMTDTLVDVFGPTDPATPFPSPTTNESADTDYQEDFTTGATSTAGTYFIEISASQQGFFSVSHNTYTAAIWVE